MTLKAKDCECGCGKSFEIEPRSGRKYATKDCTNKMNLERRRKIKLGEYVPPKRMYRERDEVKLHPLLDKVIYGR